MIYVVNKKRGIERIKKDYPNLPAFEEYSELLDAIKKVL